MDENSDQLFNSFTFWTLVCTSGDCAHALNFNSEIMVNSCSSKYRWDRNFLSNNHSKIQSRIESGVQCPEFCSHRSWQACVASVNKTTYFVCLFCSILKLLKYWVPATFSNKTFFLYRFLLTHCKETHVIFLSWKQRNGDNISVINGTSRLASCLLSGVAMSWNFCISVRGWSSAGEMKEFPWTFSTVHSYRLGQRKIQNLLPFSLQLESHGVRSILRGDS